MTYTEIALLALLIVSNAWWAFQVQKLVNKLISRSYYDYKQAENVGARRAATPKAETPGHPVNTQALQALEQMRKTLSPFS